MNGLTAAKGLRRSVESAGGLMRISVPALGDAFGRGKLTTRARTGIEQVLEKAGVQVIPGLNDPSNDGWVTLRVTQGAPQLPESTGTNPVAFVAAALAFMVPVLLVLALASPDANRPGRASADAPPKQPTLLEQADDALLAGDYKEALRLARAADATRVPALRQRIVASLTTQARSAQRRLQYAEAIRLAKRAARFGRAPGAGQIVRQATAGLELRRGDRN